MLSVAVKKSCQADSAFTQRTVSESMRFYRLVETRGKQSFRIAAADSDNEIP